MTNAERELLLEQVISKVWQWRDRIGGFEAQQLCHELRALLAPPASPAEMPVTILTKEQVEKAVIKAWASTGDMLITCGEDLRALALYALSLHEQEGMVMVPKHLLNTKAAEKLLGIGLDNLTTFDRETQELVAQNRWRNLLALLSAAPPASPAGRKK